MGASLHRQQVMNTLPDISPGEFLTWLVVFIFIVLVWNWPDKE